MGHMASVPMPLDLTGRICSCIGLVVGLCVTIVCAVRLIWHARSNVLANRPYVMHYCLSNALLCCVGVPALIIDIVFGMGPGPIAVWQPVQLVLILGALWSFVLLCFDRHCLVGNRRFYSITFKQPCRNRLVLFAVWLMAILSAAPFVADQLHAPPVRYFANFKAMNVVYSVYIVILLQFYPCLAVTVCLVKSTLVIWNLTRPRKYDLAAAKSGPALNDHGHPGRGGLLHSDGVAWLKWMAACSLLRFTAQLPWATMQLAKSLELSRASWHTTEVWLLVIYFFLTASELPLLCLLSPPTVDGAGVNSGIMDQLELTVLQPTDSTQGRHSLPQRNGRTDAVTFDNSLPHHTEIAPSPR